MTSPGSRGGRVETRRKHKRLVIVVPKVYVGPRARVALRGIRSVLFGAQRPAWVDVLEHVSNDSFAGKRGVERALELRFDPAQHEGWDAVGLSISENDAKRYGKKLLVELVPGDVLITERGISVHLGDTWSKAKQVKDSSALPRAAV